MLKKTLVIISIFFSTALCAADTLTIDDIEFTESTGTIEKYLGSATEIVIPTHFNGVIVREIGDWAFSRSLLTDISLPTSMEKIGREAFSNNYITALTIPENIQSIGMSSFENNLLTEVMFEGETNIYRSAFRGNSTLKIVTFPKNISSIATSAFSDCGLEELTLPSTITDIGYKAFYNCELTSVDFPDTLYNIDEYAFAYNQISNIELPYISNSIEKYAFYNNQLSEVVIPYGQTIIKESTYGANKLTCLTIPITVTTIEKSAFENNLLVDLTLPTGLTDIGESAFLNNKLESVSFPLTLIKIGKKSFSNNNLVDITLPASVTDINDSAFAQNITETFILPQIMSPTLKGWWSDGNQIVDVTVPVAAENSYGTQFSSVYSISFEIMSDAISAKSLMGIELVIDGGFTPGVSNWQGKGYVRNVQQKVGYNFTLQQNGEVLATGTVSTSYVDGMNYEYIITGKSEIIAGEGAVQFTLKDLPTAVAERTVNNSTKYISIQNGYLNLSLPANTENVDLKLFSLQGREIWKSSVSSSVKQVELPQISAGMYILKVNNNEINTSVKLAL